jgi:hypothetical protein
MGICTKFTEIGQEIHKARIKAHSRPYVKNNCHWVDLHENPNFLWRKTFQVTKYSPNSWNRSQHIWLCTTYSTGTSLTAKSSPLRLRTGSWVVYRHKNCNSAASWLQPVHPYNLRVIGTAFWSNILWYALRISTASSQWWRQWNGHKIWFQKKALTALRISTASSQ